MKTLEKEKKIIIISTILVIILLGIYVVSMSQPESSGSVTILSKSPRYQWGTGELIGYDVLLQYLGTERTTITGDGHRTVEPNQCFTVYVGKNSGVTLKWDGQSIYVTG